MLGNDVVDLRDPDAQPESFRPRFDERVFAADERRAIARDENPLARRWAHWGAKEAAYKLAKKVDPAFIFAPSRLIAQFEPRIRFTPSSRERRGILDLSSFFGASLPSVELRSFETPDCVHVVALARGFDWGAVDFATTALDAGEQDPSTAVRELALAAASRSLAIAPERLEIGRLGRIPTVELDGAQTSLSLSLSHHGAWVGYAMTPPFDQERDGPTVSRTLSNCERTLGEEAEHRDALKARALRKN